ncbi:MFS transporter [Pelagicoccus albus]|uniref:MFS transporter n=1 Tax=Pelagicoccus albus TaxID=415222 RepID=A0A7X1B9B6_9BACT|nr:MFS transporter [Pelagicoccus albus]MBC2607937.1 MFS transporter [Pelagicoccus albus]
MNETDIPPQSDPQNAAKPPAPWRQLTVIGFTFWLNYLAYGLIIPLIPTMMAYYLAEYSIPSVLMGGVAATIYGLSQVFLGPVWGAFSDHKGRKPILLWSLWIQLAAQILWIFSDTIWLFLLVRAFTGITSGNMSITSAAISDSTSRHHRMLGMNVLAMGFALGSTLSPLIGGLLVKVNPLDYVPYLRDYGVNPFSFVAFGSMMFCVLNLWMVRFLFRESHPREARTQVLDVSVKTILGRLHRVPEKAMNQLNFVFFIFVFAYAAVQFNLSFLALNRYDWTPSKTSLLYAASGVFQLISQSFILPRLSKYMDERQCSFIGFVLAALGVAIMASPLPSYGLVTGLIFLATGAGLVFPALSSLASLYAPHDRQGEYLGLFRARAAMGSGFGPIALGSVFAFTGPIVAFGAFSVLYLFAFSLARRLPEPKG